MFCMNCGKALPDGAKFCMYCGTPLGAAPAPAPVGFCLPGRKYLACDLLILDDLGTEMTTQFTIAVLYQVVNTRLMESRATIVSTNLPVGELDRRYSAQIASRLLGAYTLYKFSGKDIRMLQKSMARPTEDAGR